MLEKNPFPGFDPKIFAPRKKEQIFRKNPPAAALVQWADRYSKSKVQIKLNQGKKWSPKSILISFFQSLKNPLVNTSKTF